MVVERGDCDAGRSQCLEHRIDLVSGHYEIPVTAALPPPVGWKLIAVATPIDGGTSKDESPSDACRVHLDR